MSDFEFLHYLPTPQEQYFRGVATIRAYGKVIIKYKVINRKDGNGFFIAAPNYKLPVGENGAPKYVDAIMFDSKLENDELQELLRNEVSKAINAQGQRQQQQQTYQQQTFQQQQQKYYDEQPF